MSHPRRPSPVLPIAITLTVLLGLYAGAYYAMVNPGRVIDYLEGVAENGASVESGLSEERVRFQVRTSVLPWYGSTDSLPQSNVTWERFFFPAHWLDRSVRPHVWEPTP